MIKTIMIWASRIATLNLLRLLNLPFILVIRVIIGIYNAVKAHMPETVEFPYEVVKKKSKSFTVFKHN